MSTKIEPAKTNVERKRKCYTHERTFHRILGVITSALTATAPHTAVHLFADGERLVHLLTNDRILPEGQRGRLEKLAITEKDEEALFAALQRVSPEHRDELEQLKQNRERVRRFIYTNLGVYRVSFFVSLYGDLTFCHVHPFLPKDNVIVGPRFDREKGDKLQRRPRMLPWSQRLELEEPVIRQLWEHQDLTVIRAFEWFESSTSLTDWERKKGRGMFVSEGFYYFHAFERAVRFGYPGKERPMPARDAARDLGLIRRGKPTKRLQHVFTWLEAAFFCEMRHRLGEDSFHDLLAKYAKHKTKGSKKSSKQIEEGIRMRMPLIRKLSSRHALSLYVQEGNQSPPQFLTSNAADGEAIIRQMEEFIKEWVLPGEEREDFARSIRPVIDIDVFQARDFNALVFPLEIKHRRTEGLEMRGVVFISTTIDFLDDLKKHETKVDELRTIFTLLGNWNLQVALETELLRAERLRHVAEEARLVAMLPGLDDPGADTEFARSLRRIREMVADDLRNLEITFTVESIKRKGGRLIQDVEGGAVPNSRFIDDLINYARLTPVNKGLQRLLLRALVERVWDDQVKRYLSKVGLAAPALENKIPENLEVTIEPISFLHMIDNLLSNAAEAVMRTPDQPADLRRVLIEAETRKVWTAGKEVAEIIVRVIDFGPELVGEARDPSKWFEPGFSYGKTEEWNMGFGLASAWKTVARHGGRIWAERADGGNKTIVSFTLPVRLPEHEIPEGETEVPELVEA